MRPNCCEQFKYISKIWNEVSKSTVNTAVLRTSVKTNKFCAVAILPLVVRVKMKEKSLGVSC